jgi:hypothetical protein
MSKIATKEELFGAKLETFEIDIPRLGKSVRVRELSGKERDIFQSFVDQNTTIDEDGKPQVSIKGLRVRLIQMSIIDENGNRMFSTNDLDKLGEMPAKIIETLATKLQKLNGIGDSENPEKN